LSYEAPAKPLKVRIDVSAQEEGFMRGIQKGFPLFAESREGFPGMAAQEVN